MDLGELKQIGAQLGGTLNDVVLSIAAGALGRFLHGRGIDTTNLDFRAMVPVNVRRAEQSFRPGNQVSMMVAQLAMAERDPASRVRQTHEIMSRLKGSRQSAGIQGREALGDLTSVRSRMQAIYPLVPPFGNQALGIALFSYNGTLHWGFNADWDAVPDLRDLVEYVQREYRPLRDLLESVVVESPRRTIRKAGTRRAAGRAAPRRRKRTAVRS